ncbi:hypothetical protein ACI6Q5_00810 [Xanthomonas codiaei]|uniref:Uncharacterized protein n=1 Tax=Xanthomonas codiaei TaxID=56463 RepID=A0ABW9MFX9_9XANT|nr:hypothetical protein [Xanthomonas codiaei]
MGIAIGKIAQYLLGTVQEVATPCITPLHEPAAALHGCSGDE